MKEFLVLLGQIFLIACLQSLTEVFVDPSDRPYQAKILNIACFAGSMYLLLDYVFTYVLGELVMALQSVF